MFSFLAVSSVRTRPSGKRMEMLTSRVFHGRFFHSPLATLILSENESQFSHSLTNIVLFALSFDPLECSLFMGFRKETF